MFGIFLRAGGGLINSFVSFLGILLGLGLGGVFVVKGPIQAYRQLGLLQPDLPAVDLSSALGLNQLLLAGILSLSGFNLLPL